MAASYAESRGVSPVWYQLDTDDNDPATFFYCLTLSVRERVRSRVPQFAPEHATNIEVFARHFFRAWLAQIASPTLLILDNYHVLTADSPVHRILLQGIEQLPEGVSALIASRSDPPPQWALLLAKDQLGYVDWSELRLSEDETHALIAAQVNVTADTIRDLHRRSDGWAAGLTLMIAQLKRRRSAQLSAFDSRDAVFSYFAHGLFDDATPQLRDLLIKTALFPMFTAKMAEQITGNTEVRSELETLNRNHLFIEYRQQGQEGTYQYHDLLREFLRDQAHKFYAPWGMSDLFARAASIAMAAGQSEVAFTLFLDAGDAQSAATVLSNEADALIKQGRDEVLRARIGMLPEGERSKPWMEFWRGKSLTRTHSLQAVEALVSAYHSFHASQEIHGQARCLSEIVFAHFLDHEDISRLDPWIDPLISAVNQPHAFASPLIELQTCSALLLSLVWRRPQDPMLSHVRTRVEALLDQELAADAKLLSAFWLMLSYHVCCEHTKSDHVAAKFGHLQDNNDVSPETKVWWLWGLGFRLLVLGEHCAAITVFERGISISEQLHGGSQTLIFYCKAGLAWNALMEQEYSRAEEHQSEADGLSNILRKIDQQFSHTVFATAALARGDLTQAHLHAEHAHALNQRTGIYAYRFMASLRFALVLIEEQRYDEARHFIEEARQISATSAFHHRYCEVKFLEAYSNLLQNKIADCERSLQEGLASAKQCEHRFWFRYLPNLFPRLLSFALDRGIETDYVLSSIRKFRIRPPSYASSRWPWPIRIQALGEFSVWRDGQIREFGRKSPRKLLQFLKMLICLGGESVAETRLIDMLWPDDDGDKARKSFAITLKRLRTWLGHESSIELASGLVSLNKQQCWVDALVLNAIACKPVVDAGNSSGNLAFADQCVSLYRGCLLPMDADEPWSVSMRERLRARMVDLASCAGQDREAAGVIDQAITFYARGIDADELAENCYQGLIRCYLKQDRKAEALSVYKRLRQVLFANLAINPSPGTEALMSRLAEGSSIRSSNANCVSARRQR